MAKLYLNDLASVLIEKHKLTKQEASRFLTAIVEVGLKASNQQIFPVYIGHGRRSIIRG